MPYVDAILIFLFSLLIGTAAILVGARLVVDRDAGVFNAAFTALVGALAWAASALFLDWIPLVGVFLMLLVWVGIINWRYPGGFRAAVGIGFVAWVVAVAIVYALAGLGVVAPEALGIPWI